MDEVPQNIKVVFLSVATHLGGGEKSLFDLIRGLHEKKCEVLVILPQETGPLVELLQKRGIRYQIEKMPTYFQKISRDRKITSLLFLVLSFFALFPYFLRLIRILQREKPHILHTNGIKCHLIGALLSPFFSGSLVWHGRDIFSGFTRKTLLLFSSISKPWIIFNSEASAAAFGEYKRKSVIYNGFEIPASGRAPNLREEMQKPFVFGILGVLAEWKGQDLFLQLAERLKKENCGFVIIGGRIYDTISDLNFEKQLKETAKNIPSVKFCGHVENPIDYLRQIDCLVHCSKRPEPFGRVAVEAQLAGIPVIASAGGGILEIVEDHKTGFLYPMGDLDSLEKAAREVLQNPALRSNITKSASISVEKFSLQHHVNSVLALYRQLI